MTRGIAILGSTGSVGTQALDVIDHHPGRFRVVALAAGRQVERLAEQARRYRPALLSVADAEAAAALRQRLQSESGGYRPEITWGQEGLIRAATHPESSLVLTSVVGAMGVEPTLAAIEAGKTVALANKETLVVAGAAGHGPGPRRAARRSCRSTASTRRSSRRSPAADRREVRRDPAHRLAAGRSAAGPAT